MMGLQRFQLVVTVFRVDRVGFLAGLTELFGSLGPFLKL